jgi:hypothetical protein
MMHIDKQAQQFKQTQLVALAYIVACQDLKVALHQYFYLCVGIYLNLHWLCVIASTIVVIILHQSVMNLQYYVH